MRFIHKTNQYLIERFPTVWNTKIVWMILISLIVHIVFFFIGYQSHQHPTSLQQNYIIDDYFRTGIIFVHIIVSLLLLTAWLVSLFKNNAFKGFYPMSRWQLFGHFLSYLVIIFCSVSFYFSYMFGFQAFIKSEYPDNLMKKNIEIVNQGAV